MILKEFEGLPGGRDGFAARNSKTIIAYPYYLSIVTCKWLVCCEMAERQLKMTACEMGD